MTIETRHTQTAALMHLSQFAHIIFPLGGLIVPLVIWSIKKHEDAYVDQQGKSIINFEISLLILDLILIGLLVLIGLMNPFLIFIPTITLILVQLIALALIIYGAVQAANGNDYEYPRFTRFIK